jgi:hypothetical protein
MKKFVILLVCILGVTANATLLTYTYSKPISATNWTEALNVQQFDPSLGTLNSVTLTVEGGISQTFMFENTGASAGTIQFSNGKTTGCLYEIKYAGSDLVTLDILNTPSYSFTAFDGNFDFGGTSGKTDIIGQSGANAAIFADGPTLGIFTGLGTVAIDAKATGRSYWQSDSGNISVGVSTRAGADIAVTYDYTVPEPATMVLLGLGALLLRRKHG